MNRTYDSLNKQRILDIPAILLTLMIRSEAHEYRMKQIIERAKFINIDFDSAEVLSVQNKVSKGKQDKPDRRAIRDATAHARFKIESDGKDDYIIKYNNTEDGYSFIKDFSRRDLLYFYQDYDRMTILQTRLFTIRLLISFLRLFFVK